MKKYGLVVLIFLPLVFLFPTRAFAEDSSYSCSVTHQTVSTIPRSFFGMFTPINRIPVSGDQQLKLFQRIKDSGIYSVRVQIQWHRIERVENEYQWENYDSILQTIESVGLRALPVLIGVPSWARPSTGPMARKIVIDPERYEDWQDFVAEATRRYGVNGGTVANVASDWEIWNEPNGENFFQGTPQDMVTTLNLAYQTIKSIDPQSKVWSQAASTTGLTGTRDFFEAIVKDGYFDVLTIHLYATTEKAIELATSAQQYLRENGNSVNKEAKLSITETNPLPVGHQCESVNSLSEQEMADIITNHYACLSQAGADSVYYFMALDLPDPSCSGGTVKVGILNPDLTPRALYSAIKEMITIVSPQTPLGDLNSDGKVDIFDYNILVENFGNPYTIFDYNTLVERFGT